MRPRRRRARAGQGGFTLIELLIGATVAAVVALVLLQLAVAGQRTVRTQAELTDLQQRMRVATEALYRDLRMAGAGPPGAAWGPLAAVLAPVRPSRFGERTPDPEIFHAADRISILYVPDGAPYATLLGDMAGGAAPLLIDTSPAACRNEACGFSAGDRVLIVDASGSGAHELTTLTGASTGQLATPPLTRAYRAGSPIVGVVQRVYSLNRSTGQLMYYDGERSEGPVVDSVADLDFTYYARDPLAPPASPLRALTGAELSDGPVLGDFPNRFDADLLRIERIRVVITLRTGGALGDGQSGSRRVSFDVSPRNMSGAR